LSETPLSFKVLNEIGIINQLATNRFEGVMPHGMTISQFQVLNHFVRLGGQRQDGEAYEKNLGALGRAFQVSKATISGVVANLERKGFVSLRADPSDGRGRLVAITEKGKSAHQDCISAIAPHLALMTQHIPPGLLENALPALVALRTYLDESR
jgi:DNA-binding MarR family transcriptional regulator